MTNPKVQNITSNSVITGIQRITSSSQITNTRKSITSWSRIIAQRITILCDGQIVNEILDEFGVNLTLRVVTKSISDSDDPYSTVDEVLTDYEKVALIQTYTDEDEEVREGIFKSGEIVFEFKPEDTSLVEPGNRINYDGTWYEIQSINKQPMMDTNYRVQARVAKI